MRTRNYADHALVFMIRGIQSGWKIPIYVGFCNALTRVADLTRVFKSALRSLDEAGFRVVASVCDQLGTNAAMMRQLMQDSNKGNENPGTYQSFNMSKWKLTS